MFFASAIPAVASYRHEVGPNDQERTRPEATAYVVDHSAYAAAFGGDATPLREAIRQTVAWARSRSDQATEAVGAAHATTRS